MNLFTGKTESFTVEPSLSTADQVILAIRFTMKFVFYLFIYMIKRIILQYISFGLKKKQRFYIDICAVCTHRQPR